MLKATTAAASAIPGYAMSHQARKSNTASYNRVPHVIAEGSPAPRKLRYDSVNIAPAAEKAMLTMIGEMLFGRTWRNKMRKSDAPTALADSTKSNFLTESTCAKTILAVVGQIVNPMIIIRF